MNWRLVDQQTSWTTRQPISTLFWDVGSVLLRGADWRWITSRRDNFWSEAADPETIEGEL